MINSEKTPSLWDIQSERNKAEHQERQERQERRFDVFSNIVTLLLTCAIIISGFMLPTLLYPHLYLYHDDMVQLPEPVSGPSIFTDPPTLHPWTLYDEESLQPLGPAGREFLETRGIPQWLLAVMQDCGMKTTEDDSFYHALIIDSFSYLDLPDSTESGYYFLVDLDLSGDGIPDLRCAVDSHGNLVSFILGSNYWDSTALKSPIGLPLPVTENNTAGGNPAASPGTDDPNIGDGTQAGANPENQVPNQGNAENGAEQGTDPNSGVGGNTAVVDNPADKPGNTPDTNQTSKQPPTPDDLNIWSFSYVISREALLIEQRALFDVFRQLEFVFETRYGYPYTKLLPIQSTEEEDLPDIEYVSLVPNTLKYDQYILYIYYLPTGETLVLYLLPTSLKCMGFNLLL